MFIVREDGCGYKFSILSLRKKEFVDLRASRWKKALKKANIPSRNSESIQSVIVAYWIDKYPKTNPKRIVSWAEKVCKKYYDLIQIFELKKITINGLMVQKLDMGGYHWNIDGYEFDLRRISKVDYRALGGISGSNFRFLAQAIIYHSYIQAKNNHKPFDWVRFHDKLCPVINSQLEKTEIIDHNYLVCYTFY